MPEGRYGHPTLAELAAMDGQNQLYQTYKKWDALLGERVASAGSLPAPSARPAGHQIYVDDEGDVRITTGSSWVLPGSPPGVKLMRTSGDTYSVPNNVSTQIANARLTQQYAVGVTVTTGADLRVTIQRAGRYRVSAALTFYNNASGARILRVNKNSTTGTTGQIAYASGPGAGSALTTISVATDVVLAANDAIRLHAFQNSGGTLELMSSADTIQGSFLDLTFIGAT